MPETTEHLLAEQCNLIIRKTHEFWRRSEYNAVFVIDRVYFPFGSGEGITQAQEAAEDALNASDGCKTCSIREICKPLPVVVPIPTEHVLYAAEKTEFK